MGKYKVGDKVRIKSLEWWENNKNESGVIETSTNSFRPEMTKYCGKETAIIEIGEKRDATEYHIAIDEGYWYWNEEFLEDATNNEQTSLYTDLANAINKVVIDHKQSVMVKEIDGGIIIKPIEEKEEDLPIDTPVMIKCYPNEDWKLAYYAGEFESEGKIVKSTWCMGLKSEHNCGRSNQLVIIPFDKFNPNDIEESLKHNIVK